MEAFNKGVPKFVNMLTKLQIDSPGPRRHVSPFPQGDRALEAFIDDIHKFISVLTQVKFSSPGPRIQVSPDSFKSSLWALPLLPQTPTPVTMGPCSGSVQ